MIIGLIILGVVIIMLIGTWIIYNSFVGARNIVEEAYSGIDVQLKKRFELIPNLIEAVKGYNNHEASVLEEIVRNRSGASSISEVAKNDQSITGLLKNFRIQVEGYPDLKSNVQFLKLMDNLSEVENELAMARRYYNGTARDFNTKIEVFPNVLIANLTKQKEIQMYAVQDDNEKLAPKVDLT
jgi:LemA protein